MLFWLFRVDSDYDYNYSYTDYDYSYLQTGIKSVSQSYNLKKTNVEFIFTCRPSLNLILNKLASDLDPPMRHHN